jgi:endonuclease/exonuclease/phosphatase family metal-dependent hydrolase
VRLVSYNIHACVGGDGRRDPERIAAVLARLAPDVVALQEVDSRTSRGGLDQAQLIAAALGMGVVEGPLMHEGEGHYGNAMLSRWPQQLVTEGRFTMCGPEPRGWLAVDVTAPGGTRWRIVNTHLDLMGKARSRQLAELAACVARMARPLLLAGDLNEWRPWRRRLAGLPEAVTLLPALATFPAWLPLVALDRLGMKGARLVEGPSVDRSQEARQVSDHLPLWAELTAAAAR